MINDREIMEKIIKENEIDIVISVVGGANILDQIPLVEAIKSVGTIKVTLSILTVTVYALFLLCLKSYNIHIVRYKL